MRHWKICGLVCLVCSMSMATLTGYAAEPEQGSVLYGIGSVSKMYTAAAVMKLQEQGKISLDTPVTAYLPEFYMEDERYVEITPRMLLNHSSGLQGSVYTNSMTLGGASSENHDLLLERLRIQRLKADPGSFSVYCNDGFTLLEILVERVSGMSFTQYLQKIFGEPLGIENLETPMSSFDRNRLAGTYISREKELAYESANVIGSGGIYSTAEDLCRFFQIFTKESYTGANPMLTEKSVKDMEKTWYLSDVWSPVPEDGSSVAYGLGWDTVEEYPFKGYGIKALSKGGDTTSYHTGVTVLPEENVSCAVTVSGGNSMAASLAVQSILKEYLTKRGKITGEKDMLIQKENTETMIPEQLKSYEGWYASGMQMMEVKMEEQSALTIRSYGTEHDTTQTYRYQSNGSFVSDSQGYLSLSGSLLSAEGGVHGITALRFMDDSQGKKFIAMETYQYQPGMGTTKVAVPFAQNIEKADVKTDEINQWKALEQTEFLMTSELYNSAMYLDNPSVTLFLNPELPGYLGMRGVSSSITRIMDGTHAEFFQQIPGHSGRDLNDISVTRKDGKIYLENQIQRFCNADSIPSWETVGERLVIANDAVAEPAQWYEAREAAGRQVTITAPENGHFYIYREGIDGLVFTASSMTGDSGRPIYLPEACKVLFVGEQGAVFQIQ